MVKTKVEKLGGEKGKPSKQLKLRDFHIRGETQKTTEGMAEEGASGGGEAEDVGTNTVLAAIDSMREEFSSRFDGVMTVIESTRKEISDCNERVSQVELRISKAEDDVASLQIKLQTLESKHKTLEDKVLNLESRSRRNNLRLVGLPEGVEGLNNTALQSLVVLERVDRIGPLRDNKTPLRTRIMKFLNYKDKVAVTEAAQTKREIKYKDQQVQFYTDLAAGIQQLRKQFDPVRKELCNLGIHHGVIHPARVLVTHEGRSRTFKTPQEAQEFIEEIQKEANGS